MEKDTGRDERWGNPLACLSASGICTARRSPSRQLQTPSPVMGNDTFVPLSLVSITAAKHRPHNTGQSWTRHLAETHIVHFSLEQLEAGSDSTTNLTTPPSPPSCARNRAVELSPVVNESRVVRPFRYMVAYLCIP